MSKLKCTPVHAILTGDTGPQRVYEFRKNKKYDVLNTVIKQQTGNDALPFYKLNPNLFIGLLQNFTSNGYNGIRIHIACYPDTTDLNSKIKVTDEMKGQLTLFFVPTIHNDKFITGSDDLTQFWHLSPDGEVTHLDIDSVPIDKEIVTNWIKHYRDNRMNVLEQEGQIENPNFKETRSLWYDIKTFTGGGTDDGLLAYLLCATSQIVNPDNYVTELYIQWAAFRHGEGPDLPQHQLSLIFHLRQKDEDPPSKDYLSKDFLVPKMNLSFGSQKRQMHEVPTDTGIPCPPATNCDGGFDPENP